MQHYAPVVLFVYKRLDLTKQAIESLKNNNLATFSHLYIFSDAAKSAADAEQVRTVREYIASIDGFAAITVMLSETNKGCANSIITGVSSIFEQYDNIIVVEDDLVVTSNFLDYMNSALDHYSDKNIFSICGHGMQLHFPNTDTADVYYLPRAGSWGWATWKDRWNKIDWTMTDYSIFKDDKAARKKFNLGGTDMSDMLDAQMRGKIDSWAIRWCYAQYKLGMLTVYPKISKVRNDGYGQEATHTRNQPAFRVTLDDTNKTQFDFTNPAEIDKDLLKQFTFYYNNSLATRLKRRLKMYLHRYFPQ